MIKKYWQLLTNNSLHLAWLVALVSMVGSLYFGEVLNNTPCVLCWYQRIAMYPLVLLIPAGILMKDRHVTYYSLILAISGWALATYHNLLYYGVIKEDLSSCKFGVSCTTRDLNLFGFVGFPLLSLLGFTAIIVLLYLNLSINNRKKP